MTCQFNRDYLSYLVINKSTYTFSPVAFFPVETVILKKKMRTLRPFNRFWGIFHCNANFGIGTSSGDF